MWKKIKSLIIKASKMHFIYYQSVFTFKNETSVLQFDNRTCQLFCTGRVQKQHVITCPVA